MLTIASIWTAFLLGLATPLTAVCVLPLYPGFLSFLASSSENKNTPIQLLGLFVVLGIVTFMLSVGLIFSTILQSSLTNVVNIVSPIAFIVLIIIGIMLLLDKDFSTFFPHVQSPTVNNPLLSSFLFGLFFGAIVLPCNPGFIATFFTRQLLVDSVTQNLVDFLSFGIGMGAPLLAFSLISITSSKSIISYLTAHKTIINRASGILLILLSLYFLIYDFQIFTRI